MFNFFLVKVLDYSIRVALAEKEVIKYFVQNRVKNIVEMGEYAGYLHFLFSTKQYQK